MKMLVQNLVFVFLTLALCCLFFVVSGIQYWVTLYMRHVLDAPRGTVIIGFVLISTTAPILGVLTGGYVSDYYGGYKGKNLQTAMKICIGFGVMAFFAAVPSGYVTHIVLEIFLLWFLLFFGACVVPSATGIIVNTMPKEFQSSSSAVSQLVYNLAGFFLAPVLSALIMDRVEGREKALTVGFRFCLSFSLLSLVFAVLTYLAILRREKGNVVKDNSFEYVEYEAEDVQAEIARRVKPLSIS
jgi:sugar phosphate permease